MKNVNVFVDVDLTLIDANGRSYDGAAEGVKKLKQAGCNLFLWSTGGGEYAQQVARNLGVEKCFDAFLPKPDIAMDDMPGTTQPAFFFIPRDDGQWPELDDTIISKHVD